MEKLFLSTSIVLLSSCALHEQTSSVGIANPASVYCEKIGGKLDIVKGSSGELGYCTLPGGERIEEWALYRRDNL